MGRMKEFFDEAYGLNSEPTEAEIERMQLQAAMNEVSYITEEFEELLHRNRYYAEEVTYVRVEKLVAKLKQLQKTYN